MILYSIPVHECIECVKQMCDGILFYDKEAIVVLHVSKSQNIDLYRFDNKQIIVNNCQYETKWGWDLAKIHISNYLYVKNDYNIQVDYIVFLSSNCLMIKNPTNFIKQYDAGFSEYYIENGMKRTPPLLITDKQLGWGGPFLNDVNFLQMLLELNSDKKYGCMIDGCYVKSFIMDKIDYYYSKYFSEPDYLKYINCPEEMIFPTIACNLSDNISESLLFYTVGHYGNLSINEFKNSIEFEKGYIGKGICRSMDDEIRKYYDIFLKDKK